MKIRSNIIVYVLITIIVLWILYPFKANDEEFTFTISEENSLNQYVKPFKIDTNYNYQTPVLIDKLVSTTVTFS